MATYRVYSGASGAANGTSWTDAYTTFAAGLAAATTAGDEVWLASDHNEQLSADATYAIPSAHVHANPLKIYSINRADDTLAAGAFIGHDTLNRGMTFNGTGTAYYMYGVTLQVAGSTFDHLLLSAGTRQVVALEVCKLYMLNTASTSRIQFGAVSTGAPSLAITRECEFKWGHASQGVRITGRWESYRDTTSAGATHPDTLILSPELNGGGAYLEGADISNITTITNNTASTSNGKVELVNCKMKASFVMLSIAASNGCNAEVFLRDCSDGDNHYHIGYANNYGTLLVDTGIYANDAITTPDLSWKITTTANASYASPFVTPWISAEHSGTSAITPYLECLRSGSTTAFTDAEVWAETMAKVTAGSTRSTFYTDRVAPRGTAANQASSSKTASDWTGEHASSNWFGKLGQSSLTPAEAGFLRMRVCMGVASQTIYVDPQIRV